MNAVVRFRLRIGLSLLLAWMSLVPAVAHADTLRLVSFNVWGVPSIAPQRQERIREIAIRLATLKPDVVALQEVWEDEDAAELGRVLSAAGLTEQRRFGPERVGGRGSGLWMASRHPIVGDRFEVFDVGHKPYIHWHVDYLSNKGVAFIDIKTPTGVVTFADTHFQSTYTFGDYTFIQLAQSLVIARAADASDAPLVLAGDINAEPDSIVARALMAKVGLTPGSRDLGIDIVASRSSSARAIRVDKVEHLYEAPVEFATGIRRTLSDHPCLVADLTVSACEACETPDAWPDVQPDVQRFLATNGEDTALFMTTTRTASIGLASICGLVAIAGRKRKLSRVQRTGGVGVLMIAMLVAGWLAYVGWSYGPYKLDVLAHLRELMH